MTTKFNRIAWCLPVALLAHGAIFGDTPIAQLFNQIKQCNVSEVDALIKRMPKQDVINAKNEKGVSALSYAINKGCSLELIKKLLYAGGSDAEKTILEMRDKIHATPLAYAISMAATGDATAMEIVGYLINRGADLYAPIFGEEFYLDNFTVVENLIDYIAFLPKNTDKITDILLNNVSNAQIFGIENLGTKTAAQIKDRVNKVMRQYEPSQFDSRYNSYLLYKTRVSKNIDTKKWAEKIYNKMKTASKVISK